MKLYGDGRAENETRCIEEVFSPAAGAAVIGRQCQYHRGHGKDGLYCAKHSRDTSRITPYYNEQKKR